jgi:hypothetical protein
VLAMGVHGSEGAGKDEALVHGVSPGGKKWTG